MVHCALCEIGSERLIGYISYLSYICSSAQASYIGIRSILKIKTDSCYNDTGTFEAVVHVYCNS